MALNEGSRDLLEDAPFDRREGDRSRDMVELEARRSRPQSLVKSHQNEYKELITADISLVVIEYKVGGMIQRGLRINIPKTKERVFTMPSLLRDGTPVSLH